MAVLLYKGFIGSITEKKVFRAIPWESVIEVMNK